MYKTTIISQPTTAVTNILYTAQLDFALQKFSLAVAQYSKVAQHFVKP